MDVTLLNNDEQMQCLQTKHTKKSQQNGSAKTTSGGANKAVCSCGGHGAWGPFFGGPENQRIPSRPLENGGLMVV